MKSNKYHDDQPTRLALLEQSTDDTRKSLDRIEANMTKGFSDVNKRIDYLSSSINNRLWRNFYFMIGGFAGVLAMVAHGFKWF